MRRSWRRQNDDFVLVQWTWRLIGSPDLCLFSRQEKVDLWARNTRSQSDSLELKSRRLKHLINSVSLRSQTVIEEFPPALLRHQSSEAIISDWMRRGALRGERSASDELSKYWWLSWIRPLFFPPPLINPYLSCTNLSSHVWLFDYILTVCSPASFTYRINPDKNLFTCKPQCASRRVYELWQITLLLTVVEFFLHWRTRLFFFEYSQSIEPYLLHEAAFLPARSIHFLFFRILPRKSLSFQPSATRSFQECESRNSSGESPCDW